MTKTNEWGEEVLDTKTKWVKLAHFNAKCPKCEASIGANHLDDLIAGFYDHFVDAHVVGGSFD
jgi:ribosomal protein S27AE